jgi:putative hydrolase of the HAD superfamily
MEGLWCRFEGEGSDVRALREWSPTYRREAWRLALADQGVDDAGLAEEFAASGLSEHFEAVVVSADLGVAKPDPSVFEHALSELGTRKDLAVMVGDSIPKDVDGALAAGLSAVWVNRSGSSAETARDDLVEISTLSDLPDLLGGLG